MAAHAQSIQIRVLAASTGICYPISLHPNELTVANIRRHLAGAVPPQDQILLLGPPYKVPKDSTLRSEEVLASLRLGDLEDDPTSAADGGGGGGDGGSGDGSGGGGGGGGAAGTARRRTRGVLSTTERTGAKRLFLFSKQALSEASPDPPPCVLGPMDLALPTEPDPSPVVFRQAQQQQQQDLGDGPSAGTSPIPPSPLHQALEVYERRFMLHLCRGRALADGADVRLGAMRQCVAEQAVMARALRAAVSNLSDHRNGAARTRTEFTATFQSRTSSHAALLGRFESTYLQSLAGHALHPSLVNVARASGRVMETLLDTVPVERERAWAAQCQTAHQRLMALFAELDASFAQLGTAASREEEARLDLEAEEEIKALSEEVEGTAAGIRDAQARRLDRQTSDHGEVVRVVMRAISGGGEGGGGSGSGSGSSGSSGSDAQAAFTTLEEMSKASTDVLPSMESDDVVLKEMMVRVADAKTRAMKRMRQRLRQVSVAQSAIQRVLSSVGVLRDALAQQCDNMVHLEHVAELPASYRDFLSEIRRRRAYGGAVTSTSEAMIERLASMRVDEVKARERFLRGSGRHLMPAFFEIFVPTLATPPPLFTPQLPSLVEMDTLPDVGAADETDKAAQQGAGGGSSSLGSNENDTPMQKHISADHQGVSSASTLTDSQPQQQDEKGGGAMSTDREAATVSDGGASTDTSAAAAAHGGDQEQSLIVSADERSNDIIMETAGHEQDEGRASAEAERKTLAYENAILRQAIERMGGKTPRTYIEEAQEREGGEPSSQDPTFFAMKAEVEKLRSELEVAKKRDSEVKTIKEAEEEEGGDDAEATKPPCDKISHSSFAVGDVGLFMPTGRGSGGKRTYLAFHSNCPHRYLSTDSIEGGPDYVLGRIVYQEELVAGAVNTDSNPYGLHPGTKFWVLTVEVLRTP